jgi:hypothetical protein
VRTSRRYLTAIAMGLVLIAGACGSSKKVSGGTTTVASGATTAAAPATTKAAGATTAAGSATTVAAAASGGAADDAVEGKGAAAFEAAMKATESKPLTAAGAPFVISMANLEGDAGGSFPDIREGSEAAVKLINERLGGIGADYKAGKPGRPIKLQVCSHKIVPDEAQKCATQIAGEKPNLIINGIDFFSPGFYPVWQGIPVLQDLPIFIADFNQPGVFSAIGGCPVAFAGGAQYMAAVKKYDRIAVPYANNDPGNACWTDTQQRFYQYYKANESGPDFKGLPDKAGDPSDNAALVQGVVDFLKGAAKPVVYFGVQSSDCVEYIKGLRAAGYAGDIVVSTACDDASVKALPESKGLIIEVQEYKADAAGLTPFHKFEIDARTAAIKAYGPKAAESAFMHDAFATIVWAQQITNDMVAAGKDPFKQADLLTGIKGLGRSHLVGRPPVDCSTNTSEYQSICLKTVSFATWDGKAYVADPALGGKSLDLTDLFNKVAAKNPRPKG